MDKGSKKLFIDTSSFISFIDRADFNHQRTTEQFEILAKQKFHLFTSIQVVINTYNRIEKAISPTVALDFLQAILESNIQILYPTKLELTAIFRFYKSTHNYNATFSEMLISILMNKNNISKILSYDSWNNLLGTQKFN